MEPIEPETHKNGGLGKRSAIDNSKKVVKHLWEDKSIISGEKNSKKWDYLEHHGVQFPKDFEPNNIDILYEGKTITLSPIQQEISKYWIESIGSDYENHPTFRKNVAVLFESTFSGKYDFEKFDFSPVIHYFKTLKETKKSEKEERKKIEKEWSRSKKDEEKKKKEIKQFFRAFALIDERKEKMGGYMIEPPSLFKGRGMHPKNGFLKARIYPEDITINVAAEAPVPKCDMPGRAWKEVVHNNQVTWLAYHRDEVIKSSYKYFFLSANSKFKAKSDMMKYQKARDLKNRIITIREDYWKKINSKSSYNKQLGVVIYLIDKLALRVGNEKNDELEADTVGCCSLRFEHIKLEEDNHIHLNFLGKDSIEYENTIKVEPEIYNNFRAIMTGKKKGDNLFEKINPSKLNEYLQSLMKGLTAKVFRTYNASHTLDKQLSLELNKKLTPDEKVRAYNDANKKVAVLCNHQKAADKDFDEKMLKYREKISDMEEYLKQLHKHLKLVNNGKKGFKTSSVAVAKNKVKRVFGSNPKDIKNATKKFKLRLDREKDKLEEKIETKNVSLGTSKINYNDPRISVAWCKRVGCPIEKIFSKDLRSKFAWAMTAGPEWKF